MGRNSHHSLHCCCIRIMGSFVQLTFPPNMTSGLLRDFSCIWATLIKCNSTLPRIHPLVQEFLWVHLQNYGEIAFNKLQALSAQSVENGEALHHTEEDRVCTPQGNWSRQWRHWDRSLRFPSANIPFFPSASFSPPPLPILFRPFWNDLYFLSKRAYRNLIHYSLHLKLWENEK